MNNIVKNYSVHINFLKKITEYLELFFYFYIKVLIQVIINRFLMFFVV